MRRARVDALLQVDEWLMTFGVPKGFANQCWYAVKLWDVRTTERRPCFSVISFNFAAISSRAWSQEISSNFPSPRSPTRFKGFLMRIG